MTSKTKPRQLACSRADSHYFTSHGLNKALILHIPILALASSRLGYLARLKPNGRECCNCVKYSRSLARLAVRRISGGES